MRLNWLAVPQSALSLSSPPPALWPSFVEVGLDDALAASRVTRADVHAKLREANALDLSRVRAVVLETTGDISVLHGDAIDPVLLDEVRR